MNRRTYLTSLAAATAGVASSPGTTTGATGVVPVRAQTLQAKLAAADGNRNDRFGQSVALSTDGNTALVGAFGDEEPEGNMSGSAYVFDRAGGEWTQVTKLSPDNVDKGERYGREVALSGDGRVALVGAPAFDRSGTESSGTIYAYERSGGSWSGGTRFFPSDDNEDLFGHAVAVSEDGTIALVGAPEAENVPYDGGAAYAFDRAGGSWTQAAKLVADDGDEGDLFGQAVALSGEGSVALVGAPSDEDPNGQRAGAAYTFDRAGGGWSQGTKLVADDGDGNDQFGRSVDLSADGGIALLGAYLDEDPDGRQMGSAYVFDRAGGAWSRAAKLSPLPPDVTDGGDRFGLGVALSADGTTALVGAHRDDDPIGTGMRPGGSAQVFDRSGDGWTRRTKFTPEGGDSEDLFGYSVDLSADGTTALLGAPHDEDPNGEWGGSAYVFDLGTADGRTNAPEDTTTTTGAGSSPRTTTSAATTTTEGSGQSTPGFGLPGALLGLGGAGYWLYSRREGSDEE